MLERARDRHNTKIHNTKEIKLNHLKLEHTLRANIINILLQPQFQKKNVGMLCKTLIKQNVITLFDIKF